jgi:peroxiredoxin
MAKSNRSWIPYALLSLVAAAVVLLAWVSRARLNPVEPGARAPDFSAYDLEGGVVSLRDYRGQVVLINIWATWCAPCKEEMPSIQRLLEAVDDDDFHVLAVSIDQPTPDHDPTNPLDGRLRAFADSVGITFPVLHDPSGEISTTYRTTGVPESFLVDRNGIILRKITGPTAWDADPNVDLIRRLLEE